MLKFKWHVKVYQLDNVINMTGGPIRPEIRGTTLHFSGRDCECLPIGVPSQIAVDCKSVHFQ